MTYDHSVKVNGQWFNAGVEIKVSAPVNSVEPKQTEENKATYKRSDILKMRVDELKKVAKEIGIVFDEETSGNQLKKEICAKLGV